MNAKIRLGVNIDHVATLRNARDGHHPSVLRAAQICKKAGADKLTIHLREDRRHIRDSDVLELKEAALLPINFEMAPSDEMFEIALKLKPYSVCIVPEKREEKTTESGLDLTKTAAKIENYRSKLIDNNIKLSLFLEPSPTQIEIAARLRADSIEFHTGDYAHHFEKDEHYEIFQRIIEACKLASEKNIECHAGHGLDYQKIVPICKIPEIIELNIGHFIIGEAIFEGLEQVITKFKKIIS